MGDLEATQPIEIITDSWQEIFNERSIIGELSDVDLDDLIGDAAHKATEDYEDEEKLHDALHIWRVGMAEHHRRIDEGYRTHRQPYDLSD